MGCIYYWRIRCLIPPHVAVNEDHVVIETVSKIRTADDINP